MVFSFFYLADWFVVLFVLQGSLKSVRFLVVGRLFAEIVVVLLSLKLCRHNWVLAVVDNMCVVSLLVHNYKLAVAVKSLDIVEEELTDNG